MASRIERWETFVSRQPKHVFIPDCRPTYVRKRRRQGMCAMFLHIETTWSKEALIASTNVCFPPHELPASYSVKIVHVVGSAFLVFLAELLLLYPRVYLDTTWEPKAEHEHSSFEHALSDLFKIPGNSSINGGRRSDR